MASFNRMTTPIVFSHFDEIGKDDETIHKYDSKVYESEINREYCLDSVLNDPKNANDINFYKDVIKRLIEDLKKLRRENVELKDTVLSFTKRLPQVLHSLSTLSATIEAEAHSFFAKRKSEDETDYSHPSGEGSLTGEDYVESDLLDETSDEESRQAAVSMSDDGTIHPVQNFVEVVSEEDNAAVDGLRVKVANNSNPGNGNGSSNCKEKKDDDNQSSITNANINESNIIARNANSLKQSREMTFSDNQDLAKVSSLQNADKNKSGAASNCYKQKTFESALKEDVKMKAYPTKKEQKQGSLVKVSSFARSSEVSMNISNNSSNQRYSQQRMFSCDICGRKFSRSSNLLHHAMRHRNERPHQCKICDRAFVQKANLKVHLRSHTGERPYACDECGKAFAQKNNALRHLRAHARQRQRQEKTLQCPTCGKSFERGDLYETHMKRAHSDSQNVVECRGDGQKTNSVLGNANICPTIVTVNIPQHESPPQYITQYSPMEDDQPPALSSAMPHPVLA